MDGDLIGGGGALTPDPNDPSREDLDTAERVLMGQWSGPLPPPAALDQFERAAPGAAKRILQMAEQEEDHRHEQERVMLRSDTTARARGQWMAFLIAVLTIAGGVWLISAGKQWAGLVAVLTPLATLVGMFLYTQSRTSGRSE